MRKRQSYSALIFLVILAHCWALSCGDVSGEPSDSDSEDVTGPDGEDTTIDTAPDMPVDTPEDTGTDTTPPDSEEDTVEDTVEPDAEDVVEEALVGCEEAGGYCITIPGSDPCPTCEDVGGTHYLPARGHEGAMECTAAGGDTPYCCLPVDMTSPPECVTGGGGCYRRRGASGNVCPLGWVEDSTMACGGPEDCCVPGPSCT